MSAFTKRALLGLSISTIVLSGCLSGGSSNSSAPAPTPPEQTAACPTKGSTPEGARTQQRLIDDCYYRVAWATDEDGRLIADATDPGFPDNVAGVKRWSGVLNRAGYRIEVPDNWNGQLVMWAHGFRGPGPDLTIDNPPMRAKLLEMGYAWAASSYSANAYDVKAGVEDTNRLALNFSSITNLEEPDKLFIAGFSMGGHVAGAAIENDNRTVLRAADLDVSYSAALPMCGVMGDTTLFDYFGAYTTALLNLGDEAATSMPVEDAEERLARVRAKLWTNYAANKSAAGLTEDGLALVPLLQNLTGGTRPVYQYSFGEFQDLLQGFTGSDGTIDGILVDRVSDTRYIAYRFTSPQLQPNMPEDPYTANLSPFETFFNDNIVRISPVEGANGPRGADNLRWIPKIEGDFDVPVLTIHGLGDLFVPISMQQIYRKRAEANGNGNLLVQRAIRAPGHCDFTVDEINEAFEDLIDWENAISQNPNTATRPDGDDLLDASLVAQDDFGCQFTRLDRLQFPPGFPVPSLPRCDSFSPQ
ncbi:alpha/beta hydrolase [Pseudomonas sp.]|uniref:alpha/beta hydrolase n=1 Tax=Pseudomonas sp. TaxID=306 RepID=UPI0027299D74|nr:alpha/beta hydrolase [Pseudomonas sp.]